MVQLQNFGKTLKLANAKQNIFKNAKLSEHWFKVSQLVVYLQHCDLNSAHVGYKTTKCTLSVFFSCKALHASQNALLLSLIQSNSPKASSTFECICAEFLNKHSMH